MKVELKEEKRRRKAAEEAAAGRLGAKQEVEEQRAEIDKLHERHKASRREADDVRLRLAELNGQHQVVVKERDSAVADSAVLRATVAEVEADKRRNSRSMQRRAAENETGRAALELQLKQAQETTAKFQRQAGASKAEAAGLRTRLQQALNRTEALQQAQQGTIKQATAELHHQIREHEKAGERKQIELADRTNSLITEQERADEAAAALEDSRRMHREEEAGLKLSYEELTAELDRLRDSHTETETMVQSAVGRMRAAETEAAASWGREQVANEKAASLQLVLERQRNDFFAAEAEAAGEGAKNLATEKEKLAALMAELDAENAVLDERSGALDRRHTQLQAQTETLQEQATNLEAAGRLQVRHGLQLQYLCIIDAAAVS